jgi:hypothetical protein
MIDEKIVASIIRKGMVYSSVSGFAYLNINNIINLCPFCGNKMKPKQVEKMWDQICECKASQDAANAISLNLKKIKESELKIIELKEKIEDKALEIYQQYYKSHIINEIEEQLKNDSDIILNIKTLKGVISASRENNSKTQNS